MLAPFYLFNLTKKANVYIVARDKTPILIKRDLYVLPQITFKEADSLGLKPDVIIIPALSKRDEHQDAQLIGWIKTHVRPETKMMAICDRIVRKYCCADCFDDRLRPCRLCAQKMEYRKNPRKALQGRKRTDQKPCRNS